MHTYMSLEYNHPTPLTKFFVGFIPLEMKHPLTLFEFKSKGLKPLDTQHPTSYAQDKKSKPYL